MEFDAPVSQPLKVSEEQQQTSNRPVRNWSMEPTSSDIPVSTILQKITDPQSIWCLVAGSSLSFVVVCLVLLYFKPNVVVDNETDRVCPKKLIFVALVAASGVFGLSFYLRHKYT